MQFREIISPYAINHMTPINMHFVDKMRALFSYYNRWDTLHKIISPLQKQWCLKFFYDSHP
jgi:predicted Mrr-cat superfamily restriction endonuclease